MQLTAIIDIMNAATANITQSLLLKYLSDIYIIKTDVAIK